MIKLKNSLLAIVVVLSVVACGHQAKKSGYIVKGTIEGIGDGTLLLKKEYNDPNPIEFKIKDGSFTVEGEAVSEPKDLLFEIKEADTRFGMYVENGENTFHGILKENKQHPQYVYKYVETVQITGSIVNDHEKYVNDQETKIREKYNTMKAPREHVDSIVNLSREATNKLYYEFIKQHPKAYYSSYLASRLAHGEDAEGLRKILELLDVNLSNSLVKRMKEKLAKMELTDVKPSEIIKAKNVSYKVAASFKGEALKDVLYLGVFSNDNVCALSKNGSIQIVTPQGKVISQFKPQLETPAQSIAIDSKDQIYVIYPEQKDVKTKFRGKEMTRKETYAHKCAVYSMKGEIKNTLELAELKTATGARIADGKLIVADWQSRKIAMFDTQTGERKYNIDDMRPCCAILDFSINDKNEILVANLGAFRVQAYDMTGKNLLAFGKRGKSIDDFHGCCNPVSVAYLSNGAIVTVEKDPTRVKIFSSEGAKQIEGIQELVKGCSYIPMIVDSKDNLYLASPEKGMIKCVSI